jgi:hypothetical protein
LLLAEDWMALDLFGRGGDVAELIAKKKYAKAIELLREQLGRDAGSPRLRLQLSDVLVAAGRPLEAIPVLIEVADYFAEEGEAPKAIAALKKVERIAPGRRDVEARLADLIKGKSAPKKVGTGWDAKEGEERWGSEAAGKVFSASDFIVEAVVTDEQRIAAAKGARWEPSTHAEDYEPSAIPVALPPPQPERPEAAAPRKPVPVAPAPGLPPSFPTAETQVEVEIEPEPVEVELTQVAFESQMMDVITDALKMPVAPAPKRPAAQKPGGVTGSPLFSDFSGDELVAVIHGLRLLSFDAGDIIITEGDPGDSLFVLASGTAKAFVRRDGKQALARRMEEGTFFGEISILSGKPRTATVTAATHCELLELDRATLDEITKTHPHVQQVLEEFYIQRATGQPDAR